MSTPGCGYGRPEPAAAAPSLLINRACRRGLDEIQRRLDNGERFDGGPAEMLQPILKCCLKSGCSMSDFCELSIMEIFNTP